MRFKLICCEVFLREICLAISASEHTIDPFFTPKGRHEKPEELRRLLQDEIKEADKAGCYDAILLGYGLCGNAADGIFAGSTPLVIPRAHDCCTVFLGSKASFREYFGENPSLEWSSAGYMERGDTYLRESETGKKLGLDLSYRELVERYGDDNARYVWESLHPEGSGEVVFIDVPETSHLGYLEKFSRFAKEQHKAVKVLAGDMRLIKNLVDGRWNEDEFLVVEPGQTINAVYDMEKVICAVKTV